MEQNPFAPPTAAPSPAEGGLIFSAEGVEVVSSLAKWMRGLSIFYGIGIGLAGIGSCGVIATIGDGNSAVFAVVLILLIFLAMMIASMVFLREAASGFERGVYSDDEMTLGAGFRSLRIYLIMFGVMSIFSMLGTLLETLGVTS